MNITSANLRRFTSALLIAALPLSAASAQQLEEIVVTAQKREQSLQDVPISVSAVSGDQLQSLNRTEIFDLSKTVAGFSFKSGSSDSDKSIQIRGVGTATFSRGVEQTVGTVIDGVVSSSVVAGFLDFSGVERVEVLRGPQGMLFGKNASAGLLSITTKKPSDELSFGGFASFGDEGDQRLSAYVSGGVTDTVKARIEYYANERDAYIKNTNPQGVDFNSKDEWGYKGKLLIEPTDDLSLYFIYSHAEKDSVCCGAPTINFTTTGFGPLFESLTPGVAGPENDTIFTVGGGEGRVDLDVMSAEINYSIGEHTLTSITSKTETELSSNLTGFLAIPIIPVNSSDNKIDQFTQELRITSPKDQAISYVAGLYYYKNELDRTFFRVQDLTQAGFPIIQSLTSDANMESESKSVFGQATWNASDATRLSLGLRYNEEDINKIQTIGAPQVPLGPFNPTGAFAIPEVGNPLALITDDSSISDTAISWRVILEHDFTDSAMVYGSVARGYKGPGANTLTTGTLVPFVNAEVPTNMEIGIKSEWMDGRLRVNGSIFSTVFENFQASALAPGNGTSIGEFILTNAGELETEGFEVEVTFQATDNWLISANLIQADSVYNDYQGAPCFGGQLANGTTAIDNLDDGNQDGNCDVQDLSGTKLPFASDLSYNLFSRYDLRLESLPFSAYVQGSYHWQDEVQLTTTNDPLGINESYGVVDVSLGIESEEGTWGVQLWVKNATDKFYRSGILTTGRFLGLDSAQALEYDYTRRVGVSLTANF